MIKRKSFVSALSPMHAQGVALFYRAFTTRDDFDIMASAMLVQEYARIWQAMRLASLVKYGCNPCGRVK